MNLNGTPASGSYDLTFALFDTPSGGTAQGSAITNPATSVSNGLFTVTLDFGAGAFNGTSYWLEIGVETNSGGSFTTLAPRQQLTPAPYALYAESASASNLVGTIPAGSLSGVALLAGGNAFSGSQTISGSVGIGTPSPAKALDVTGTASGVAAGASIDPSVFVRVNNTSTDGTLSSSDVAGIGFGHDSTRQAIVGGTYGNDNLDFYTGGLLTTPKMRIDYGGNVGIGTNKPAALLDVNGSGLFHGAVGVAGTVTANSFAGNGGGLTNLNVSAAQLTSIGNTSGGANNFFLGPSGNASNSGSDNTANGYEALYSNTSGSDNAANGYEALADNTIGSDNTADGYEALVDNTSGSYNTAIGAGALQFNTSGSNNTANGFAALASNTSGSDSTANGFAALAYNTSGSGNTANGYSALFYNTGGSENTANGYATLYYNTGGSQNTANGYEALFSNTSGSGNTANGYGALAYNTTNSYNTATGFDALAYNTSGDDNTANGFGALQYSTSGSDNTANGFEALQFNTSGSDNIANGEYALNSNTTGSQNTADGYATLANNDSGSDNIALGFNAGLNITGSSNIDIGNSGLSTDSNIIRIGTTQTAAYMSGTVYAKGVALTSDRNAKENFTTLDAQTVLARVASLPVTEWNYKAEDTEVRHLGPMAQDFHAAFGLNGGDDKHISIVDESGVALAAIQGLNQKLREELNHRDTELSELKAELSELRKTVNALNSSRSVDAR